MKRFRYVHHLAAGLLVLVLLTVGHSPTADAFPISGMGNYCSLTWPNGGWAFASDPAGGDPCQWLINQSDPGYTVARKGLYSASGSNNVVVRCNSNKSWVGIYRNVGNGPLTAAYDSAVNNKKSYCVFTVAPVKMPIFNAPFSLAANYSQATGFDHARPPYTTLNVADFGQPGSTTATIVDNKGRDKSNAGYIDNHAGIDWFLPKGTAIRAAADGTVVAARDWMSTCTGSDSKVQKEVAIKHTVSGQNGYYEQFVTYYAHLSSYVVTNGQAVTKGQLLGYSGNTGCSTAPHLHFGTLRLTNTAAHRLETLHFFDGPEHSDGSNYIVDPYGFSAPKGFEPWAWRAYPAGALSTNLWSAGQAPSQSNW
jgi:murein DD-endopeptidase MepM/ murein hydrolase activator NlpD